MWDFFMRIWNKRRHYCQETGKWLGREPKWTHFHHLLEKSTYPEHKYADWNIMLVHPDAHEDIHQKLKDLPNVKRLTDLAWEHHLTSK